MKLFIKPGACSLSPHIVLEELGLPYETETVDFKSKKTASGADYLAINSKGYVPALLLEDGTLLTEGPAIVQYLADLKPEKKLAPANGTPARYQLQSWLTFVGMELHRNFTPQFNPAASQDWKDAGSEDRHQRFDPPHRLPDPRRCAPGSAGSSQGRRSGVKNAGKMSGRFSPACRDRACGRRWRG